MVTTRKATGACLRSCIVMVVTATATVVLPGADAAGADTLEDLANEVSVAVEAAADDPYSLVASLPGAVTSGHESAYQAILSGDSASVETVVAQLAPDDVAQLDGVPSSALVPIVGEHAPEADPLVVEQQAVEAIEQQGSATWPFFKGEYLHPAFGPPYGQFTPNCENNWCMPDLYISDYNSSNYCSLVPDLWFKWPCYQHDLGYTFIPRTSSESSLSSRVVSTYFAVNTQWYSQMRHECDEQIRGLGPVWIFCQLTALTYFLLVTAFSFPAFASPNETTGYDALEGPASDPSKPPVHLRWHACTGEYTESFAGVGFTPLHGSATVDRGSILYLTGRTHRGTRALFEFRDAAGSPVANHLTAKSRDNCVIHHEPEAFSTLNLPVGTYQVVAWYYAWEGSGTRFDEATGQRVAYGQPRFDPAVLTLTVTDPPPAPPPPPPPDPDPCFGLLICMEGSQES